jgi:hypothetical protein
MVLAVVVVEVGVEAEAGGVGVVGVAMVRDGGGTRWVFGHGEDGAQTFAQRERLRGGVFWLGVEWVRVKWGRYGRE